jgi:hypothetical protein
MELKDFVAETLKQIVEGTEIAQKEVKDKKAVIGPRIKPGGSGTFVATDDGYNFAVQMIDFEVSLTETKETSKSGKIGVLFSPIGAGAQAKSETEISALNRVKFSVPMILPRHYIGEL